MAIASVSARERIRPAIRPRTGPVERQPQGRVSLELVTLGYLALPWFLFVVGWLWWPYAAAISVALSVSLWRCFRSPTAIAAPSLSRTDLVFTAALAAVLVVISGAGGYCAQAGDWTKHMAMLHDLTNQPWPVRYPATSAYPHLSFLVYYIAYYLPAAAVGKLLGPQAAVFALMGWTFGGLLLVAGWLRRLLGRYRWPIFVAWFLLGGMHVVGAFINPECHAAGMWRMSWWAKFAQYSSNLVLVYWVPQHALGGWLGTFLVMDTLERGERLPKAVLALALTGLWSPFVMIGLAPFVLCGAVWHGWRRLCGFSSLVPAMLLSLVAAIYLSSVGTKAKDMGLEFAWDYYDPWVFWKFHIEFIVLEVGAFVLLALQHFQRRDGSVVKDWNSRWLVCSLCVLSVLSFFHMGSRNDFVTRVSIPCLAAMWICVLRVVLAPRFTLEKFRSSLLVACLVAGAVEPLFIVGTQLVQPYYDARKYPCETVFAVGDQDVLQYLGPQDGAFYKHLARR